MTAATNSAVERSSTRRMSQLRRHDRQVRQDREADDDPGDDPGRQEGAGVVGRREQPAAVTSIVARRGRRRHRGRPQGRGCSGSTIPSAVRRRPRAAIGPADGQPSIAGTASPRGDGRSARAAAIASRRVATGDDLEPVDRGERVPPRRDAGHDGPSEAEAGGLAQPALEADHARAARRAARPRRWRPCPAAIGRSRDGRGERERERAGRARARRPTGRRRGWRRRRGCRARCRPAGRGPR